MKIRLLSTFVSVVSLAGIASAYTGADTRLITTVRDRSGHPVQGASLKFFGPIGSNNRRIDISTSTGRNGESERMMVPGRYFVLASDNNLGIDSRTFDVSDRSSLSRLDLKLQPTRRPTIQFVVMSDDRNEPVSNALIEITNRQTGRRDSIRSRGNGFTQFELPTASSGGRFDVRISSTDFDTKNTSVSFSPRTDTSSEVAYVELRRKTGQGGYPTPSSQSKYLPKLDGMIRLSNKNRVEAGDVVAVNVGLTFSGGRSETGQCISTVEVTSPNGGSVLRDSRNVKLTLNDYANTSYDVSTRVPGTYTVTVSAVMVNGSGVQNSRWDGKYTFNVQRQSSSNSNKFVDRGDYTGFTDIEMDNRGIKSHTLSLTIKDGPRSLDTVKGWLAPRGGSGFHIQFEGTFDQSNGRLDAKGIMSEREDKRWDIRITGSPDRNGRLALRLTVRALDNSYNRSFDFTLARK